MRSAPDYKQIKYSKSNFKYLCDISAFILKYFVKDLSDLLDETNIEVAHASVNVFRECLITATDLYQRKFADFLKVLRKCIRQMRNCVSLSILIISSINLITPKLATNQIDIDCFFNSGATRKYTFE